jgi:DNA polymerase elongation subunit (family B)
MDVRLLDARIFNAQDDSDGDAAVFSIQLFGNNAAGETVSVVLHDFKPSFYCLVPSDFDKPALDRFEEHVKQRMGTFYAESLLECFFVSRKKLDGFDGQAQHRFVCFKFKNMMAFNKAKNIWFKEMPTKDESRFSRNPGMKWTVDPAGYLFKNFVTRLYESNIPPLLRFFHIQKISPSGWVRVDPLNPPARRTTTCVHEGWCLAENITPLNKETPVPYKICSFDIEASSSHGDFPQAIKDYKKLAQNIVDQFQHERPSAELLKQCVRAAFGFGALEYVDVVYPKEPIVEGYIIDDLLEQWVTERLPEAERGYASASDSDEEAEETVLPKFNREGKTVVDLMLDPTFDKEAKIHELKTSLNKILPPLEGDRVTFIGSTFVRYGTSKPYLNHCLVVGGAEPVENAVLDCLPTERDILLAWAKLVQREDPDVLIGYNIFGFDEDFMFKRAMETGCIEEFLVLTRNRKALAGREEKGEWKIEEKAVFLASGEYNLRYFNMEGRLQIDLYTMFRRDYTLDSYKLDSVSAMFISGKISRIEKFQDQTPNITKIYSSNLKGLEKGNYILLEAFTHTSDFYKNGKQMVTEVHADHFVIEHNITGFNPPKAAVLKWCLAKDDVDHHQIFELAKGSDADRSVIAKYCIQDCNLVHHLFQKIDVLTGYIEMANICSVPIEFLIFRGQGIKLTSYISKKCRERGVLMPVLPSVEDDDGYEGAIVLDPKCDMYTDPVAVGDFASLYPSCMIAYSTCSSSLVWTETYDLDGNLVAPRDPDQVRFEALPGYTYVDIPSDTYAKVRKTPKGREEKVKNGHQVCRFAVFPDGEMPIMPAVLKELLLARKTTRKKAEKEEDEFMKNIYDKRQLAYKVTANSLYGQCGARTSTFYNKAVAASCTAMGRILLMYAKASIEEVYCKRWCETKSAGLVQATAEYVYGDTDSVFFKFTILKDGVQLHGNDSLPVTIELAQEVCSLASQFLPPPHELEYEKTFFPFILLSKKRYVGMKYEFDVTKCYRSSMGIVLKRRDNAPIVKDVYGGIIDRLMGGETVQAAATFLEGELAKLVDGRHKIDKLVITKALRSGYKNPLQIAHKVLAERIGRREPGNKPRAGDRIEFVYFKTEKVKGVKQLQGEKIETVEFMRKQKLVPDYPHYITNQIMKPVQQVFAIVLEQLPAFQARRPKFERELAELRGQQLSPEKYADKVDQLRLKEIKFLLFDKYI